MGLFDLLGWTVARLVPLLFAASLVLVVGRALHDRYRPAGRAVARGVFAAVGLVGVLCVTPYVLRTGAFFTAQVALLTARWAAADRWFARYAALDPSPSPMATRQWALAMMHLERFADAESTILAGVEGHGRTVRVAPYDVYLLGICRYYQQRWQPAERTLGAVRGERSAPLVDYYLGRLAERGGRHAEAAALYRESLRRVPGFLPAAYQLARVDMLAGIDASADVEPFLARAEPTPLLETIRSALAERTPLPPAEFRFSGVQP